MSTNKLRYVLATVNPDDVSKVLGLDRLLAECWGEFDGSHDGGMEASKLLGRMEKIHWKPPILHFVVERHGGTVCGSTRAELQHWEVNLNDMTAQLTETGQRQLEPMTPRLSIKALAEEIAQAILNDADDGRFDRDEHDGSVVVNASMLFPTGSGYKRTVEGRRMRLCKYIEVILSDHGWRKVRWNKFRKEPAPIT
jgi:hypothetical protein